MAERRAGRRALIAVQAAALVIGSLLLLWAADGLARLGAQTLLEHNIARATGVVERPQVAVRGWFFLPQVIRGVYEEVHVTTRGITSGPLRIAEVESTLYDVRVPYHDVLVRDVRQVGIVRSSQRATLTYDELNIYFEQTGRPLRLSPGEGGLVEVNGTVDVLGNQVDARAQLELSVLSGTLRMSPRRIETGDQVLDAASRLLLRQRFTLPVPMGTLPFGHELTQVSADAVGVRVAAESYGVIVDP